MANEALAFRPEAPDNDYDALCAALETSARGRAFLAEHARRNRNADTERVLEALDRLSAQIRADAAAVSGLHDELRALLGALRLTRPGNDAGQPPGKAAMLAALVDLLERRIDAMVEERPPESAADGEEKSQRLPLSVVPPLEEPELPIPSPLAAQPPAIAAVPGPPARMASAAVMPEVNVLDGPPAAKPATRTATRPAAKSGGTAVPDAAPTAIPVPVKQAARPDPVRLLAPIMALSEDERLALFS